MHAHVHAPHTHTHYKTIAMSLIIHSVLDSVLPSTYALNNIRRLANKPKTIPNPLVKSNSAVQLGSLLPWPTSNAGQIKSPMNEDPLLMTGSTSAGPLFAYL